MFKHNITSTTLKSGSRHIETSIQCKFTCPCKDMSVLLLNTHSYIIDVKVSPLWTRIGHQNLYNSRPMVIIIGGPQWLVLLSWKISLTAQTKVDSSLPMSLILVHSSLDTILILLFFLSFHYSPEQKLSMVTNSVLNFPLFWQLKKSFNQKKI